MNNVLPQPFYVCQREWAITGSDSETPILKTEGIAQCVGLIIHSSDFKVAALAHLDGLVDRHDVDQMMGHIQAVAPSERKWKVIIIGGHKKLENIGYTDKLIRSLIEEWKKNLDWTIDDNLFAKKDSAFTEVFVNALNGTYSISTMEERVEIILRHRLPPSCAVYHSHTLKKEAAIRLEEQSNLPYSKRMKFTLSKDFCKV